MLSILLLEIYQSVGKHKVIFEGLGDVKREEFNETRVPKVYKIILYLLHVFFCNHSFILITVVMVYFNFGGKLDTQQIIPEQKPALFHILSLSF